jgi:hypothetical protein
MPDYRVLKVIDQVSINDLNNLPDTLEVLYVPFFCLEENTNFNFPPMLKKLFVGCHPSKKTQNFKLPYGCELIIPNYESPQYYDEFFRIEKLFKEECLLYVKHQILYLKKNDLKRL